MMAEEYHGRFQKTNENDTLLPFYDILEQEEQENYENIKAYFASTVLLQEETLFLWCSRFNKYLKVNNLRFSKEDHLLWVKIFYDLATIPDSYLSKIQYFLEPLIILLNRKKFLEPGVDLTLDWRPLYNLCKRFSEESPLACDITRAELKKPCIVKAVSSARYYFSPDSTQEILDEFRPFLYPNNNRSIAKGIELLSIFLPISPCYNNQPNESYKLWLDEMMLLWQKCSRHGAQWEASVVDLIRKLAWHNIGRVDFNRYLPFVCARILKMFQLPVKNEQRRNQSVFTVRIHAEAELLVAGLGGENSSADSLLQLLKTLESFCYPANSGPWTNNIKAFLKKIVTMLVLRLRREKSDCWLSWDFLIPESKKMSEEEIGRVVTGLNSISMVAMTSGVIGDFSSIFQKLAAIRSDLVVPQLVEKFHDTLVVVTEPRSMMLMASTLRYVVHQIARDEQTRCHVVPLFRAVLTLVEPSNTALAMNALQMFMTMAAVVPLVDCSEACNLRTDLTDEEKEVAAATAEFEDIVLQLFDRIFVCIDSLSQEETRIESENNNNSSDMLESHISGLINQLFDLIVGQVSKTIFLALLEKTYNHIMFTIIEREVAGRMYGLLLNAFASYYPEETYRKFVPELSEFLLNVLKNEDVQNENRLDNEFLHKLSLLVKLIGFPNNVLIKYLSTLESVLDKTMHLTCIEGSFLGCEMLGTILWSLTETRPLETRSHVTSFDKPFDTPVTEFFPVREWGKSVNVSTVNIKWDRPAEKEINTVEKLVWKYLNLELELIDRYLNNEVSLTRQELYKTLSVLCSIFDAARVFAVWEEEPIKLFDSMLGDKIRKSTFGYPRYVKMEDGSNIFKTVMKRLVPLQERLLRDIDDPKVFHKLVMVWFRIIFVDGETYQRYRSINSTISKHRQYFHCHFERRCSTRYLLVHEVIRRYDLRMYFQESNFTQTHVDVIKHLYQLAVSDYSVVRKDALAKLMVIIPIFKRSTWILIDDIVQTLSADPHLEKEKFQGVLTLICNANTVGPVFLEKYGHVNSIFTAIIKSTPSEDPTVIFLLEMVVNNLQFHYIGIPTQLSISDKALQTAEQFWKESDVSLALPKPSLEDMEKGKRILQQQNEQVVKEYYELLQSMLDQVQNNNLHWRHEAGVAALLRLFVHPEAPYPANIVRHFAHNLIHDSVVIRKLTSFSLVYAFKQYRVRLKKQRVDAKTLGAMVQMDSKSAPGPREDNAWCAYDPKRVPHTDVEWEEVRYSFSATSGYYSWPKDLYLPAPPSQQPRNDFEATIAHPVLGEVYEFFSAEANVKKFFELHSVEQKKGESISLASFALFKYLFRNFGPLLLNKLKKHLELLIEKDDESSHRLAAEVIGALLRAMKHWRFADFKQTVDWLSPLLSKVMNSMNNSNLTNWGACISNGVVNWDVNKLDFLIQILVFSPITCNSSIKIYGRLFALSALSVLGWRLDPVWRSVYTTMKDYSSSSYQLIREGFGLLLATAIDNDHGIPSWNPTIGLRVSEVYEDVLPNLRALTNYINDYERDHVSNGNHQVLSDEMKQNLLQFITVCRMTTQMLSSMAYSMKAETLQLIPIITTLENYEQDEEVKKYCQTIPLALGAQIYSDNLMDTLMNNLTEVSNATSWSSKCSLLSFMQIFSFHNVSILLNDDVRVNQIMQIITKLLCDDRCEVRLKAGETLSGLLHYNFLDRNATLDTLKSMANRSNKFNTRHGGIIGLCSFVKASPYTVPPDMPSIIMLLGEYLHDQNPIPNIIFDTMKDFKRTHHQSWLQHKEKFTEDELNVLNEMVVPPNHYA